MGPKRIVLRLKENNLKIVDEIMIRNDCKNRQQAINLLISDSDGQFKKAPELIYPGDARCKRLYEAFLKESNDGDPKVSKQKLQKVQSLASIVGSKTMRARVEMLKMQNFLAEREKFFVVIRRYE